MKYHILLLEDVINYGRKGDLTFVAPGYARNFLLPQKKAILATRATIKMRTKLQEERKKQADADRTESEKLAKKLEGKMFETTVKVDPEGHMYGSVTAVDLIEILVREGYEVEKRHVALAHPIKVIGAHHINLRLPEGVEVSIGLTVKPDREIVKRAPEAVPKVEEAVAPAEVEAVAPEAEAPEKQPKKKKEKK